MSANLGTTNLLLGIMAGGQRARSAGHHRHRASPASWSTSESWRSSNGISRISAQVAPAMARVNAILDDVKDVTAKVKEETERVDQRDPHDDGSDRRHRRSRADERAGEDQPRWSAFVRGARLAVEDMLRSQA